MKKATKPTRLTRKPISITIHPTVLEMVDKRSGNGNRSEQINLDLARYYTLTAGKREISTEKFLKLKLLTSITDLKQCIVEGEKSDEGK